MVKIIVVNESWRAKNEGEYLQKLTWPVGQKVSYNDQLQMATESDPCIHLSKLTMYWSIKADLQYIRNL